MPNKHASRGQLIMLITGRNAYGMSPIHISCLCNSIRSLYFFLNASPEDSQWLANLPCHFSAHQWTFPLHLAIINGGHGRMVKTLLKAGADPFMRDSQGQTAWDVARSSFRQRAWNRMKRYILKHQPKNATQILGAQIQFERINSSTGRIRPQRHIRRLTNSSDGLVVTETTKFYAKRPIRIPPGPWDMNVCHFGAEACGSEPAGMDGDEETSNSSSTITTTTLNRTVMSH